MAGAIKYAITIGNLTEWGSAAYTEHTAQEIVIDTGSSDTQLNFGGITTADIFYLKSDQALTLNLQASDGTNIPVDANKPFIQAGTAVTGAWVSNSSGTNANVVFKIWGA